MWRAALASALFAHVHAVAPQTALEGKIDALAGDFASLKKFIEQGKAIQVGEGLGVVQNDIDQLRNAAQAPQEATQDEIEAKGRQPEDIMPLKLASHAAETDQKKSATHQNVDSKATESKPLRIESQPTSPVPVKKPAKKVEPVRLPNMRFADAKSMEKHQKWLKSHQKQMKQKKKDKAKRTAAKKIRRLSRSAAAAMPAHASPHFHEVDMLPVRKFGDRRCGEKVALSALGIKSTPEAVAAWSLPPAFLEEEPDEEEERSMAKPGAGANQVFAVHPLEQPGAVNNIAPFVRVYKDGFFEVKCAKDDMYFHADLYGHNKYTYGKHATTVNVSIVHYKEVIDKPHWKSMSPEVCYQFCQTVPDMIFFGIAEGGDCYCTPYIRPIIGTEGGCNIPCKGDSTQMCGAHGKSNMFEMHLCADTAEEVLSASVAADEVLAYFYDSAFLADALSAELQASGAALQKIAGESGDLSASGMGMAVKLAAGELGHGIASAGCLESYDELLKLYADAKEVRKGDFTMAKDLQKADATTATLKTVTPEVESCAKSSESLGMASYPFYKELAEADSKEEFQEKVDGYAGALGGYLPINMVQKLPTAMATCTGKQLGQPAVVSLGECAEACSRMRYPGKCTSFQFFHLGDVMPICFLYEKLFEVQTYTCPMHDELQSALPPMLDALIQTGRTLRGSLSTKKGNITFDKSNSSLDRSNVTFDKDCMKIRQVVHFSGLSCPALFGKDSIWLTKCPSECETPPAEGAEFSALCMTAEVDMLAIAKKSLGRCFGGDANSKVSQSGSSTKSALEVGEGGLEMGNADFELETGEKITEPFSGLWTRDVAAKK
eukprot:gnl/MRDRNA2_/MRDRNA2_61501_c0_seq1.p1 gnl/MRDRNA2_/MRDRNA2_61501_c0~~gnl/MRDRNA2_/MRDRNA2_61501_c0_seq1.p1  ORF type:complete len:833 (+),score=195.50 gnl/MRDRNA2_/MRDRNA2_61501_c0_seq1:108-2606(+)